MGTCLSRLKSPACPADIYSTYRQRTPGVRLATGDQCARFNSASDNVLLLITRLCAGAEVNSKNTLIGERRRDGKRERKCGEFTAPVSFSPWQRWGSVNCSVWQLPLWRWGDWLDAAWPGSASLIKGLKLISLRFHMVGCLISLRPLLFHSFSLSLISADVHANDGVGRLITDPEFTFLIHYASP